MSKPNFKVIMALMESYLAYRQDEWGMKLLENGKITPPASEWNLNKAKTCVRIIEKLDTLTKIKDIQTSDWVEYCSFLYDEEMKEEALFNKWPWPINRNHTLLDLIRAIRTYVISTIDNENTEIKVADITKHAATLTTKEDYLAQFFDTHVKINDPKYKELGETDFDSFIKSVESTDESKKRKRVLCKALFDTLHIPVPNAGNSALMSPGDTVKTDKSAEKAAASALQSLSTFKKPEPPAAPRKQPTRTAKEAKRRIQLDEDTESSATSNRTVSARASGRK